MILFALSEGWKASQNAYISLLGHKFDNGVHSPIPLNGPCPQHAIFDVTNPAQPKTFNIHKNEGLTHVFFPWVIVSWLWDCIFTRSVKELTILISM